MYFLMCALYKAMYMRQIDIGHTIKQSVYIDESKEDRILNIIDNTVANRQIINGNNCFFTFFMIDKIIYL